RLLILRTCYLALRTTKFRLCLLVKLVVGNWLAVGKSSEGFPTHILSDGIAILRKVLRLIFDREAGIPVSRLTTNRQRLDVAFDVSVLFDLNVANFRQLQPALQFESALGVSETIVSVAPFEARESCFLPTLHTTKECLVGLVQTTQRILQHLAEHTRNVWSNCFDVRQLVDLVEYTNRSTALPCFDSLLQSSVVQFTAHL